MAIGGNRICLALICIIAVGLIPTVSSYCFTTYKKKTDGTFRCRNRVNEEAAGDLDLCCSIEGSVGYSSEYKGHSCQVCESALSDADLPPVWSEWGDWSACSRTCESGKSSRTRVCDQGDCEGSKIEQEDCTLVQNCPIDGNWGEWTSWTECSQTCSEGIRTRTRRCDSPGPMYSGRTCLQIGGSAVDQENCVEVENCPIDGHWGNWQPYSACSATCGSDAVRIRDRACDSPPAQFGGSECSGDNQETNNCGLGQCPIDGKWEEWSPWEGCSKTCGDGKTVRRRSCNNPKPQYNGKSCAGLNTERNECNLRKCIEIVDWTDWSDWSPCSDCSIYKEQKRTRTCPVQKDSKVIKCDGTSVNYHICTSEADCIQDEEGSGNGKGECVGDDCCDDADGCADSASSSFSTSDSITPTPLPTKCRPVVVPDDNNNKAEDSSLGSDSVSISNSDSGNVIDSGGVEEEENGFRWVDCVAPTPTPTPEDDCAKSNDCVYSDYYDYSEDEEETPAPKQSSVSSNFESVSSDKPEDSADPKSSDNDYESSLKNGGNSGGGGGGGGGGGDGDGGDGGGGDVGSSFGSSFS